MSTDTEELRAITDLAELPPAALVSPALLARVLGVTERTLRRLVERSELPQPLALGTRKYWLAGRIVTWLESRSDIAERETHERAKKIRQFERG